MSKIEVGGGAGGGGGRGTSSTSVIRGPFRVALADLPGDPRDPGAVVVPFDPGDLVRAMWAVEVTPYASPSDPITVLLGVFADEQQFYVQFGASISSAPVALANGLMAPISDGTDRAFYTQTPCTAGEYDFYVEVTPAAAYLA